MELINLFESKKEIPLKIVSIEESIDTIPAGKYKGKKWSEIKINDPQYFQWAKREGFYVEK
jgi:uncharacterized protein (DUF3820 family)